MGIEVNISPAPVKITYIVCFEQEMSYVCKKHHATKTCYCNKFERQAYVLKSDNTSKDLFH